MSKEQKQEAAKFLYEEKKFTLIEIAEKVGVTPVTISRWKKEGKWKKKEVETKPEKYRPQAEISIDNEIQMMIDKYSENKKSPMLDKIEPLLDLSFENLFHKLLQEKNNNNFSNIRDYQGLVTKLMDLKGKITGETSDKVVDENEVKAKVVDDLSRIAEAITQLNASGTKKIEGSFVDETIDLEDYVVEEIE